MPTITPVAAPLRCPRLRGAIALVLAGAGWAGAAPPVVDAAAHDPDTAQFDTTPDPLPPGITAVRFEADRVSEVGDLVRLGGKSHGIDRVTVTLSTSALRSDYAGSAAGGFLHPLTLKIFSVDRTSGTPQPGQLLTMSTQPFLIPWQPEPEAGSRLWRAADGQLHAGLAFSITFDLTGATTVLPDEIVYRVSFSTQHFGSAPLGTPGPYDHLGVAAVNRVPAVRFTSSAYGTLAATAVLLRQLHSADPKAEVAIRDAGALVSDALNRKLWNGRHRLASPAGLVLFELLSESADQLTELAQNHPALAPSVDRAIGGLLNTAETVTASAATDALRARAEARLINRAKSATSAAGESERQRRFGEAIEQLGDAWRELQLAAP
ncbi:MAG: hypothetical protein HZA93_03160 [Verrucomicrobia bacterium]|nr:hypothetical protein [Verrucomicrobiota bacterium]